jgi:hypothetical protein
MTQFQSNKYWWLEEGDECGKAAFEVVNFLRNNQVFRQEANLRHMRLYSNMNVIGLSAARYATSNQRKPEGRLKLNIIQSIIDTLTSKIAKNRPKPTFLTKGGDHSQQQKAKRLNKFIEGVLYEIDWYEKQPLAFRDGCVFGTGPIKFYLEDGKVNCERTFVDELIIDDADAKYGDPRALHQAKTIPRDIVASSFPKYDTWISKANKAEDTFLTHNRVVDLIPVIESWHLASNGKDGKHIIAIEDKTLLEEEWDLPCFPFVFDRWTVPLLGWFGLGLAEQLTGIQLEINKLLRTIQLSMHLCAVPRFLVESGSKIVTAHLNNEIGAIVEFAGTAPELRNDNAVPPELFQHLDRLVARAYEISGVSQLSAQAKKPSGLDSGVALREYSDIESERFAMVQKSYEQMVLDATDLIIGLIRQAVEQGDDYSVNVPTKKGVEVIKWSDVKMEDDEYVMKVFPTNFLPNTPAGRLEKVQELVTAGFIPPEEAMELLDFPDTEGVTSLQSIARQQLNEQIADMLDNGTYYPPEPFQNLPLGIRKMQAAYLKAKMNKAPEKILENMRRWMNQAAVMSSPKQPEESAVQEPPAQPEMPQQPIQ